MSEQELISKILLQTGGELSNITALGRFTNYSITNIISSKRAEELALELTSQNENGQIHFSYDPINKEALLSIQRSSSQH